MAERWTEEQQLVLTERGSSLLVAAAAGSGKTAVLVERILRLITEGKNPPDIDRLLVLTFTNAAAAQMRERIRAALEKALEEDPGNAHLQKQMTLVHNAQITTIHSFCLEVVRAHCVLREREDARNMPQLPEPGFRIADEGEMTLLKQEILEQTLEIVISEEAYQPFVRAYSSRRDDRNLGEMILKLYEYSSSDPWPARWRHKAAQAYHVCSGEDLKAAEWIPALSGQIRRQAQGILERLQQTLKLTDLPGGPAGYRKAIEEDLQRFETFLASDTGTSYDRLRSSVLLAGAWGPIGRISKKDAVDEDLKEQVKDQRGDVKKEWDAVCRRCYPDAEEAAGILEACYEPVSALVSAADLFEDLLDKEKRSRGIVDFSDLEHFAMQILTEGEGEDCRPSDAARDYARRFLHVMTDEYQDSNLVQEYILNAVSGGDCDLHNRFMVGDVKQSIYRFRLARPELFLEKYASYVRILPDTGGERTPGGDCKIELHRNFRSRKQVLQAVNMVFRQIMAEDVGNVVYDEDAALVPGAQFPEEQEESYLPELYLITQEAGAASGQALAGDQDSTQEEASDEEDAFSAEPGVREKEAALAGRRIRELLEELKVQDDETGQMRPACYGDIAVLLRTSKGWMDSFSQVFQSMGIPFTAGAGAGYFETIEVRTVLSCLEIIDNPFQDIPLAAALRSPVGGLTDDDLAAVRIRFGTCDLYTACRQFAAPESPNDLKPEEHFVREKLTAFLKDLDMFREESALTPVHVLIRRLLDHTGYEQLVLAMPGGELRRANLEMLIEKAVAFEQGENRGLFRFLRYMQSLMESGTDTPEAAVPGEKEDAVSIMTIHKSKGLEYPIVFLCGLGKLFNRMDTRDELMLHPGLGMGVRSFSRGRTTVTETLLREVIRNELQLESQGEELRILYVAMTRAKEKLILTGSVKDPGKTFRAWDNASQGGSAVLPFWYRRKAPSFLDLIMPAILRHSCAQALIREYHLQGPPKGPCEKCFHDGEGFLIRLVSGDSLAQIPSAKDQGRLQDLHLLDTEPDVTYDEKLRRELESAGQEREEADRRIRRLLKIPGTLTVSRIKEDPGDEEAETTACAFDAGAEASDGSLKGAERGTLYHDILEFLDYSLLPDPDQESGKEALSQCLKTMLESMRDCGKIQNDMLTADNPQREKLMDDLCVFLSSSLGLRMRRAFGRGELYRETSFLLGIRADRIDPEWDREHIIQVQGRIDAWFLEGDKAVLVDYKTDRVPAQLEAGEFFTVHRHYDRQLDIYREALERLTPYRVGECVLYSFDRALAVSV